jgi:hypothetical protein
MNSPQNGIRTIGPGAMLVEKSAQLPESLRLESDSTAGWARVSNNLDGHRLETELSTAGWTFFYMAGAIGAIAFGFERQKMVHTALKRLIAKVRLQKCNCLEIDAVATKSFLGMPYVSVSGHSRHLKKGLFFNAIREETELAMPGKEPQTVDSKMTGTPSQIEWAEQIKPRVNAEFDRVSKALKGVAGKQAEHNRLDTLAVIAIVEEKRVEVMAKDQAGYFIRDWQELKDQARQMIAQDSRYQAIKAKKAARLQ